MNMEEEPLAATSLQRSLRLFCHSVLCRHAEKPANDLLCTPDRALGVAALH